MKYIDQLQLKGKRVLIRCDFDVPLENGVVVDDLRLRASVPTLQYALKAGARVIAIGHLGQPKAVVPELSAAPVAKRMSELLKVPVTFVPDCIGASAEAAASALKDGEMIVLENPRFHREEEKNDPAFCEQLAKLCDTYVNNAFAVSHRNHASTAGVAKFVKEKAAGLTLKQELENFQKALEQSKPPLVAIFGGAKVSTKMAAIRHVGKKAQKILIGGAMANTFFVAQGYDVGKSLFEPTQVDTAKATIEELKQYGCEIILPIDVVVAGELKDGAPSKVVPVNAIPANEMALDIGPESSALFAKAIAGAATVIWNGPVGAFETEGFAAGTYQLIDALSATKAFTVVGGGDTDLALENKHAFDKMGHVSTGGGAFLKLLEGDMLPAVKALNE